MTNDGNAILRELDLAHPAAKVHKLSPFLPVIVVLVVIRYLFVILLFVGVLQSMIELSRTQDEEVGDGTTSVIVLGKFFILFMVLVRAS